MHFKWRFDYYQTPSVIKEIVYGEKSEATKHCIGLKAWVRLLFGVTLWRHLDDEMNLLMEANIKYVEIMK